MFLSKLKFAAIVVLALGLVGTGAGFVAQRTEADQPAPRSAPALISSALGTDNAKKKAGPAEPDPAPAAVQEDRPIARDEELRNLLDCPVRYQGLDDPQTTLSEALEQLAKRYNLSFDINEDAFKEANFKEVWKFKIATPLPMPEMHTRAGIVLKKILSHVSPSATYIIRDGFIEITTVQAVRKEFFTDRPNGPYPPLVTARFEKAPLAAALKQLGRSSNVVLDSRIAEDKQALVTADLTNVPLDTAARLLADMAGLRVVRLDNVLYLTTPENAKHLREEQAQTSAPPSPAKPAK